MDSILGVAISLFFMLDPIGNVPVLTGFVKDFTPVRKRFIMIRESLFALVLMLLFLFFGKHILGAIGVEQQALSMTGGVVLFLIGLRMSMPKEGEPSTAYSPENEPFIVPIAVPFIAGPGVLAMLMLLTAKGALPIWGNFIAVLTAWAGSTIVLVIGQSLMKHLGNKGMDACQRLMGLVLTAMAVQMFMNGFREFMRM